MTTRIAALALAAAFAATTAPAAPLGVVTDTPTITAGGQVEFFFGTLFDDVFAPIAFTSPQSGSIMIVVDPTSLASSTVDIEYDGPPPLLDVFAVQAIGYTNSTLELLLGVLNDESGLFPNGALLTLAFNFGFGGQDPFDFFETDTVLGPTYAANATVAALQTDNTVIPLPAGVWLLLTGLGALVLGRRRSA